MFSSVNMLCASETRGWNLARSGNSKRRSVQGGAIGVRNILLVLFIVVSKGSLRGQTTAATSQLRFSSSDEQLVQAFEWAKKQALAYAFVGDSVGSWYKAALPGRKAFCMRDVSHQTEGAQALGLAAYIYNMLHHFATGISRSRDWCSY